MYIALMALLSVQAGSVGSTVIHTEVSAQWRVDLQAQVAQAAPEIAQAYATTQPMKNRAGQPYFLFPDSPYSSALIAQRLLAGQDVGEVRMALAAKLAPAGRHEPELILALLEVEQDSLVRSALLHGLRRVDAELALPVLEQALQSADSTERFEAASVIGLHADGGALADALVVALSDAEPQVQRASAEALGIHSVDSSFDDLELLLQAPSGLVRLAALNSMSAIDLERAQGLPLAELSQDTDPRVAAAATRLQR